MIKLFNIIILIIFIKTIKISSLTNKYENSLNVKKDHYICLKCNNNNRYEQELKDFYKKRLIWSSNDKRFNDTLWMCLNNVRQDKIMSKYEINFSCANNQLCLYDFKSHYPLKYDCTIDLDVSTYEINYIVPLDYLNMKFETKDYLNYGESIITVRDNTLLSISCEIPETNPISRVRLLVDNKLINEKSFEPIGHKLVYTYELLVTRKLQMKSIVCLANMIGINEQTAAKLDIRNKIEKPYTLDVQYVPICSSKNRVFFTGINQSLIMTCDVADSNPNVTSFTINGPVDTTKIDIIDLERGKFRVKPEDMRDFGKYDCYPRNTAGTGRCEITLQLGGYPEPPYDCKIVYNLNTNNKTTAQINCQIGFNQGGTKSEFVVYERLSDGTLKHSGSVNVYETRQKEVGYLTKELDENKYYEFAVMQTNNYGNSSLIILSIGQKEIVKAGLTDKQLKFMSIVAAVTVGCLLICVCFCCCCCSNGNTSDSCLMCSCCSDSDREKQKGTYRNVADEILNPFDDDLNQIHNKEHNQSIYTPIQSDEKYKLTNTNEETLRINKRLALNGQQVLTVDNGTLSSFRNELYQKVKQHGNELEKKLQQQNQQHQSNDTQQIEQQQQHVQSSASYESTSSSSYNSNTDLIKPPIPPTIIKPKPRKQPSGIIVDTLKQQQQSTPSTSITDLSSFTYTPNSNIDDKCPIIPISSRNNTLSRNRNLYQQASDVITSPKVSYLLNNFNGESTLVRKQRQNIVSDC